MTENDGGARAPYNAKSVVTEGERTKLGGHTPGPWRVEEGTTVIWSDNCYDPGTNCVGCVVARAAQPSSWRGSRPTADEQTANARLIAAAPDLLEALKHCEDLLMRYEINRIDHEELEEDALAKIRGAIRQAVTGDTA